MLRKLGVLVASLAMVLVSSLALVLVPAAPAAAGGGMDVDGRSVGDSPPGKGGPGVAWTYVPIPTDITVISYSLPEPFPKRDCADLADGTKATGYTIWWKHTPRYGDSTIGAWGDLTVTTDYVWLGKQVWFLSSWGQGSIMDRAWCYYPPLPTRTLVACPVSVSIVGYGPNNDPEALSPEAFPLRAKNSAWNENDTTRKDAGLCDGTVSAEGGIQFREMGRYRMDVVESRRSCWRVDYGPTQPAIIEDCGITNSDTVHHWAQQWCDNYSQDWTTGNPHTFTMAECANSNPNLAKCLSTSSPASGPATKPKVTLDTRTGLHRVLDDGKGHDAVWEGTTMAGTAVVDEVFPLSTRVVVRRDNPAGLSTPYRPGASQEATNQPFQGVPSADPKVGDLTSMEGFQFHGPSMPGKPWILDRWVTVKSELLMHMMMIVRMDLTKDGDDMITTQVPVRTWQTNECQSDSLSVTVNRARNTR